MVAQTFNPSTTLEIQASKIRTVRAIGPVSKTKKIIKKVQGQVLSLLQDKIPTKTTNKQTNNSV